MGSPKIFVGNVSYGTTKQTLMDLFGQFGTVVDCYKPEQKGFAFVTMGSPEEAEKALNELQGKEVDGRQLKLDEARPMKPRTGGMGRGGFGGPRRNFGGPRRDFGGPRQDFGGGDEGGGMEE